MTDKNQDSRVNVYESKLYIITAKTNMHVGSGETALGLVDNRVQRDVLTNIPNINASGLKGALREYYSHLKGKDDKWIIDVFGSDSSASKDKEPEKRDHRAGKFRFFNAHLLSIPVRSNVTPYFHATSPDVLKEFVSAMKTFDYPAPAGLKENLIALADAFDAGKKEEGNWVFAQSGPRIPVLEDFDINVQVKTLSGIDLDLIETFLGKPLALMNHEDFNYICSDYNLPLIARNNLENGRSKNLWHEQVVPRESRFYFFLLKPAKETGKGLEFRDNVPVQIGGNASIGYGFTIIKEAADFMQAVPMESSS
jgi:CRISPR-associated protein Cmr4